MSRAPRLALHWQILIALGAAIAIGSLAGGGASVLGVRLVDVFDFVGALFLRALRMLVVPLIISSIISGIVSAGATRALGRLGAKTVAYYVTTSALAILVGLALVDVVEPGVVSGEPARDRIGLSADVESVAEQVGGRSARDVMDVFVRLVPENVVKDAADDQMLGLIFFSILFGYFVTRLEERPRETLSHFWQGTNEVMLLVTGWVMRFAPLGVLALVAKVVMSTGFAAFLPLLSFALVVLLALAIHALLTLPLLLVLVARVSPLRHFKAVAPAVLMAFSTASSSATLPLTMDRLEHHAGVSRRVTSFTLPLGATVNMDGTALYECVAAMFIAQAYGVHLGFAEQLSIVVVALLTSIGVAGIPAASLVAITLILTTVGLPLEGIGLILAVDRILDMCRTAVNVLSDSTAAVVIGKSEGESQILTQ